MKDKRYLPGGFFTSWARVLLRPSAFFSQPADGRSRLSPMIFGLLLCAVFSVAAGALSALDDLRLGQGAFHALRTFLFTGAAVMVALPAVAWVASVLLLGWLRLGPGRPSHSRTLHASIASLAAALPALLDWPGEILAWLWMGAILSVALVRLHGIGWARAIGGVLWVMLAANALLLPRRGERQDAESMTPGVRQGERVLLERLPMLLRGPRRGEVVLAGDPKEPGRLRLLRVAALAGDEVAVEDGRLRLNGALAGGAEDAGECEYAVAAAHGVFDTWPCRREWETLDGRRYPIVFDTERARGEDSPRNFAAQRVPEGMVFLLGDNRDNARDSRSFGPVPARAVLARARCVIWPEGPEGFSAARWLARP